MAVRTVVVCGGAFAEAIAPLDERRGLAMFEDTRGARDRCYRLVRAPNGLAHTLGECRSRRLQLREITASLSRRSGAILTTSGLGARLDTTWSTKRSPIRCSS